MSAQLQAKDVLLQAKAIELQAKDVQLLELGQQVERLKLLRHSPTPSKFCALFEMSFKMVSAYLIPFFTFVLSPFFSFL